MACLCFRVCLYMEYTYFYWHVCLSYNYVFNHRFIDSFSGILYIMIRDLRKELY